MEGELHQSQTGPGEANSGTSLTPTTQPTPNPPRLTPNPTLLDSPPPTLTPASNSPPPPLTPAPSLSASHAPKSPHAPIPAPPKLTSTPSAHNPALRTYSRPILPSPVGQRSKTPSSPTAQPSSFPLPTSTSSSSPSAASPAPLSVSSSSFPSSHNNANVSAKISCPLTNGNTKPVFTATSTPVTPFHTPASPTSKQVSQTTPPGIPGLVRVNQGSSPVVRQGVSQQTLLLGKGLKGSGQDQVLLRAQMLILTSAMRPVSSSCTPSSASCSSSFSSSSSSSSHPASAQLQSLTLRPPPPGTLTIRPSLRLSGPLSAPPALSRPRTPLFPPLRPRPQPGAAATEGPTMPTRHLSVAPPALYSPVRAVPLRPRLRSPNGYRAPPPRQNSTLQPTTAASATYNPPLSKLTGSNACSLSEPSQSQQSSIAVSNHMAALSHFDRSPSAARQLQIIALSSGRQSQSGSGHAAVQSAAPVVVSPAETTSRSPLGALSGGEAPAPPLKLSSPKTTTTTSMPSPPSLFPPRSPLPPPASPAGQTGSQAHAQPAAATQRGSIPCRARENEERAQGLLHGQRRPAGEEGGSGKDPVPERDNQRESEKVKRETKRENPVVQEEEGLPRRPKEPRLEVMDADEGMEVAEGEGQRVSVEKREGEMEIKEGTSADPAENHSSKTRLRGQNLETNPKTKQDPVLIQNSSPEPKSILDPVPPPVAAPAPVPVPVPVPVPQLPAHTQRLLEPQRDIQPMSSEDICESMSTQSDNQSALSSLSSQSPPTSPTLAIPSDMPVPLLCAQPTLPEHLSLAQGGAERASQLQEAEAEAERPEQSEENEEGEPWMPKVWPEGRQVLTHLVEGFVIKEGLQPFPVNRSSLLVQEPVNPPPEVNGTNGKEAFPVTDTLQPTEQSTDSEEEEGGATDDQTTRPSQRDKAVLHCQFCGKRGHAHSFMRSKRFCSTSCARGFNVRLTKRLRALSAGSRSDRSRPTLNRASSVPGKPLLLRLPRDLWSASRRDKGERREDEKGEEEEDDEEGGEREDPSVAVTLKAECRVARRTRRASEPAVTTSTPTTTFKPRPANWSVEEVTAFIHTLPGCSEVAEGFRLQEIDGQALLLLTEEHLMTSMNIKLGPALKICAHINALKNQ